MSGLDVTPTPVVTSAPAAGFKDWALICAALGYGRQSIILRKGGIAEGRAGFRFQHEQFYLFPTQYHQQAAMVRPGETDQFPPASRPPEGTVEIRYFFALDFAVWVTDWATLAALEPFHIWREDVIRARFDYDETPGLQCAFGRVYRLDAPWSFSNRAAFGGCRSWLSLPTAPADASFTPVVDDDAHAQRSQVVRSLLQLPRSPA